MSVVSYFSPSSSSHDDKDNKAYKEHKANKDYKEQKAHKVLQKQKKLEKKSSRFQMESAVFLL